MELFREVTILCGSKRKFLTINFRSYNETIDMIKRKFGIPDGFELKVVSDHGKGNEMSIDDDEDLYRFNDSKEFIVRLLDESQQRDLTSQLGRPEAAACTSPPSYEQSVHVAKERQTTTSQSTQRKVSVVSDDTTKLVNFDMNSLAKTKIAIRTKFNFVGDFDILGKMPRDEQHYDIQNDDDLDDFKNAESFLVKRRLNNEKKFDDELAHSKNQKKLWVVSDGDCNKMVSIDMSNLVNTKTAIRKKFSIVGDFDILGKLRDDVRLYAIQDDDDLGNLKDAESFLVKQRLKETKSYDESAHSKVTIKVKFEARDEFVTIDLDCLRSTRNGISQKFKIDDDFKLLVKKKGVGVYIDVDDDEVLATLTREDILLVERKSEKGDASESGQIVPCSKSQAVVAVRIGEVDYPVTEIPRDDSGIVCEAIADLRSNFGLKGLVNNTDVVADCLRLARYGVAGNQELDCAVGNIMSKLAEMVQRNKSAVVKFRIKGADILRDLLSGVRFLLSNEVTVGITKFKAIKGKTELLKGQTSMLQKAAEDRQTDINEVLATLMRAKGQRVDSRQAAIKKIEDAKKKELEKRLTVAKQDVAVADARVEKHAKEVDTERERVKSVLDKTTGCGHACRYGFCNHGRCPCLPYSRSECCYRCCSGGSWCHHKNRRHYWYWLYLCGGHGYDERRVKAEQAMQEKAEKDHRREIKERKKLREEQHKAFEELQNYLESMTVEGGQLPDDFTERALSAAEGAVRNLKISVRATALFWDQMAEYCLSLGSAGTSVDALVEKSETSLTEIDSFINSEGFRHDAVSLYARLVALKHLCLEFDKKMKPVEVSIQQSTLDCPSQKEALGKIRKLKSALDLKLQLLKTELSIDAEEDYVDE